MHIHRRGSLRRALRASLSLPGVLPPVVQKGHVLVDGALVRNLPVDLVREQHDGVTIGVDVAISQGLRPGDLRLKPSGWRWLTSGAWLRGPPIVSVLIRSATIPSVAAMALARDDVVEIVPEVKGVGLQDWKAYDMAVASGYRATMAAADRAVGAAALIAQAATDATYLPAEVEIVATYKLFNINRVKLENLLHRVFAPARLDLAIHGRFGHPPPALGA